MINNIKIFSVTLIILIVLLFMHIYGMADNLYIKIWYYDIIMHILGGISIAMAILCINRIIRMKLIDDNMWQIILFTFLAGIVWEIFEAYFGITGSRLWTYAYYLDTTKDLVNDVVGSTVVFLTFRNK